MITTRGAILAAAVSLASVPAAATIYYASATNGSDQAVGSFSSPYRTIQKAADRMGPGDTCLIRAGVYRETIIPKASGLAGRPVLFMPYQGETVFVSAADPVTGWTKDVGDIYKAPVGWDLGQGRNQVFVNGGMMYEARVPNVDEATRNDANIKRNAPISYVPAGPMNPAFMQCGSEKGAGVLKAWIGTVANGAVKLHPFFDSCRAANAPADFLAGAMVHKTGGYWASETGIAALGWGVEPTGQQLFPGWMWVRINAPNWESGGGKFAFIGKRAFLDAQKEWILEGGTLYFRPPGDRDPNTLLVEAKRRQLVMDLRDRSYIEVRGLRFMGGSVTMKGSNSCIIDGCNFRYITHWTLVHGYDMTYRHNGESAFYIEGNNNKIINSSIEWSAGSGLYTFGTGNLIENNLIHDCSYLGTYDVGVCTGSKDPGSNTTTRNTIYNMGRSAWTLTPGSPGSVMSIPQKITYNNMYNCMFLVDDGGTLYLAGDNGGGSEIAYNWMYNMIQQWNGHHIYYDWGGGYHTKIHHNVFWQDSLWMSENNALTTAPMRHVVYNNTSIQSPRSSVYFPFDDDERGVNALWADSRPEEWGIKDWKNRDFTLVAGSRAIDKGTFRADSQYLHLIDFPSYRSEYYKIDTPIVIPAGEITGSKPDLGAYEYQKPRWVPGHTWGEVVWNYPTVDGPIATQRRGVLAPVATPRCLLTRHGLVVSMPYAAALSVRVMDLSGRTVVARDAVEGAANVRIPAHALPRSLLLVRVTAAGATRTFTVNPVR